MTDRFLDIPESIDKLYLARGDEVSPARPLFLGDVFDGIALPGVDDEPGVAMIMAHPCSMRQGIVLRPRLQMARVSAVPRFSLPKWENGHFTLMPLPGLPAEPGKTQYAADFAVMSSVSSDAIEDSQRVACLSDHGIALLLQRYTHYMSRAVIDLPTFYQSVANVVAEAELEQDWVEAAFPDLPAKFDPDRLAEELRSFHTFLEPHRADLKHEPGRAAVRRAVRSEIKRRTA